ncbi:MAG TPA: hypothetical protein VHC48_07220 [Puia sp.]|nr:hypothetical protein [Puia sp.]
MAEPSSLSARAKSLWAVYLIFLFAILYLAFLVSSTQQGVFFSSDGGIKFIVVKQFSEGHGFKYMYLPQPQWVHETWAQGFFPFKPPFIYPSPQGRLFVFPPAFPIISSFFYTWLGNTGLYIIPVSSTLLLWLFFCMILRRRGVSPVYIAIALFFLVFCSPLTIYGATFWEHMSAVLLLLSGLAYILFSGSRPAIWVGAGMGLISGFAAWFRPEAMAMNGLYGLAVLVLFIKERPAAHIAFLIGLAFSVGSFLVFNQIELGSWFGIHSYQVIRDNDPSGMVTRGFKNVLANNGISLKHFGYAIFVLPLIYALLRYRKRLDIRIILLACIVLLFCLATPFMVPNDGGRQWGARYFLPIIPVTLVVLAVVAQQWQPFRGKWAMAYIVPLVLITAYSFYRNSYKGGIKTLRWENYNRIKPDLDFITSQKDDVVVVSLPYVAMELGYLFDKKYFFLAPDNNSLQKLQSLLKAHGVHGYTYIYDIRVPGNQPPMLKNMGVPVRTDERGDFYYEHYTIQ